MAARSKAKVCGRSPAEIVGSNSTGDKELSVVFCKVEVSATSWSLVQRSPTECGFLVNKDALAYWGMSCQKQTICADTTACTLKGIYSTQ